MPLKKKIIKPIKIIYLTDKKPNREDFKKYLKDKKMFKSFCRDFLYSVSGEILDINNFDQINSFDDLAKEITTIEEKKIAFNKLVDEILGDKKRLILIIDELDRCKPTFAVEMLEIIKHFYTNEKITIIVSTNNSELSNSVLLTRFS